VRKWTTTPGGGKGENPLGGSSRIREASRGSSSTVALGLLRCEHALEVLARLGWDHRKAVACETVWRYPATSPAAFTSVPTLLFAERTQLRELLHAAVGFPQDGPIATAGERARHLHACPPGPRPRAHPGRCQRACPFAGSVALQGLQSTVRVRSRWTTVRRRRPADDGTIRIDRTRSGTSPSADRISRQLPGVQTAAFPAWLPTTT